MLIPCEVTPGMRDSERTACVADYAGRRHYLRVEADMVADSRLPVGVVGRDRRTGMVLVELPHEADSGVSRFWVQEGGANDA